jgi:hypothetical protein
VGGAFVTEVDIVEAEKLHLWHALQLYAKLGNVRSKPLLRHLRLAEIQPAGGDEHFHGPPGSDVDRLVAFGVDLASRAVLLVNLSLFVLLDPAVRPFPVVTVLPGRVLVANLVGQLPVLARQLPAAVLHLPVLLQLLLVPRLQPHLLVPALPVSVV